MKVGDLIKVSSDFRHHHDATYTQLYKDQIALVITKRHRGANGSIDIIIANQVMVGLFSNCFENIL